MRDDQVLFSIDSGLHVVADDARWLPSEVEQSARVDLGLIRIGVPVPPARFTRPVGQPVHRYSRQEFCWNCCHHENLPGRGAGHDHPPPF
jgi:hypothetical protein